MANIELIGDLRRRECLSRTLSWLGTNLHDVEYRRVLDRVFWFVGVRSCVFSRLWIVCGTKKRTRDVVEGSEGVVSRLGRDNATCLSSAV